MLNILREIKEHTAFKIAFGLLIVVFAGFFGMSRSMNSGSAPQRGGDVATVNGASISYYQFASAVENQMNSIKSIFGGNVPKNFEDNIVNSVLEQLVQREVASQFVKSIGLTASKTELKESLLGMEQFLDANGKFDLEYYNNEYLKQYKQITGRSFEEDMKDDLAMQKFFDTLETPYTPSADDIKILETLNAKNYSYDVIQIPKMISTPAEDGKSQDIPTDRAKIDQLVQNYQNGQDVTALLPDLKADKKTREGISLSQVNTLFDSTPASEHVEAILNLSESASISKLLEDDKNFYIFKRLFTTKPAPQKVDDLKTELTQRWSQTFQTAILSNLTQNADIKKNLPTEKTETP